MVLMVVFWRYRMPFDANGCVSMLVNVYRIKYNECILALTSLMLALIIVYFLLTNSKRCNIEITLTCEHLKVLTFATTGPNVCIFGKAGVGKSTLVQTIRKRKGNLIKKRKEVSNCLRKRNILLRLPWYFKNCSPHTMAYKQRHYLPIW